MKVNVLRYMADKICLIGTSIWISGFSAKIDVK